MAWLFWKIRKIKCPDGSFRYVYRNIDDVFPLYAKDWKARFDLAIKGLQTLEGALGGELAHKLSGLFFMLNDSNASLQFQCRAAYGTYLVNPCAKDDWLFQRMNEIICLEGSGYKVLDEIHKIEKLYRDGASPEEIRNAIENAKTVLQKKKYLSSEDIEEVKNDVATWKKE